jgi:opacity protein-like surface antigen
MGWKKGIICLIGFLCCLPVSAQDDFGSILSADVTKKITKGLNINFEEEFRSRSNFSEIERFSHALEVSYKPFNFLKAGGAYNLINFNHYKKGWEIRHRYYFYSTGSVEVKRFTFSLRERFQSTKRQGVEQTNTRANPKLYLRSRLKADYNIRKSKFTPYASVEFFNTLNDPQKNSMNQWRIVAGVDYKLNKKNNIELYYRYHNYSEEDEIDIHFLGIGYSFKF